MKLVVDSNAVISSLVRQSVSRRLLFHPNLELYAPEYLFEELEEHKNEIVSKASISEKEFRTLVNALKKIINVLPLEFYKKSFSEAEQLVEDPNDLPFAASAIALSRFAECGIWSNDAHFLSKEKDFFNKFGIRVWNTKLLYEFMNK